MNEKHYSMKEMVASTGVTAHTLRYYERIGLLPPIPRASSGHRVYAQGHVEWVTFIRHLRATGMPIQRILRYSNLMKMGNSTVPDRLQVLVDHREAIKHKLCELQENLERIEYKIGMYQEHMDEREKQMK
jgi:DNA-binding transcriptional MerR regulator